MGNSGRYIGVIAAVLLAGLVCRPGVAAETSPDKRVLKVGEKPESVCRGFDGLLYVTMINGDEPGDGTVVAVDGDKVSVFCTGLNSPKGIVFTGGFLVTADETTLWKIDSTGRKTPIAARDNFPRPVEFLNDVAASTDGESVYVAEMSTPSPMFDPDGERRLWELGGDRDAGLPKKGCVYRVTLSGRITEVIPAGHDALRFPNGVAVERTVAGEQVYAADFFTGNIVWTTSSGHQVLATGIRGLDGLTVAGDVIYGSSWTGGTVWKVDRGTGKRTLLLDGLTTAADFYFDAVKKQLIIPDMISGTLTFLPLH